MFIIIFQKRKTANKDSKKEKCSLCLLNNNWTLNVTGCAKQCRRCEVLFGLCNKIKILWYNNPSATSPQCNFYCDTYLKGRRRLGLLNNNWIFIVTIYAKYRRWVFHPASVCILFPVCLSPWKPKCFHTADLKLTGASASSQTLSIHHFCCPTRSVERKGWWARVGWYFLIIFLIPWSWWYRCISIRHTPVHRSMVSVERQGARRS